MTSFYYTSTPTHGKWFQINQPKHKLNDHADDNITLTSLCIANVLTNIALQWQI